MKMEKNYCQCCKDKVSSVSENCIRNIKGNCEEKQSKHFNKGSLTEIALVFSCPGQCEKVRPVSGQTGTNLDFVLKCLVKKEFIESDFDCRYDFRITNASMEPHWKKNGNGRAEDIKKNLIDPKNICRLYQEIKDIEGYIICFGINANFVLDELIRNEGIYCIPMDEKERIKSKRINVRHLSLQSINQLESKNFNKNGQFGKTQHRLLVVVKDILEQARIKSLTIN